MNDHVPGTHDSILICPKCLTQYPQGTTSCEQDGSSLKHLVVEHEESLVGKTIDGRWVIERKLGSGGMGTVYLANQINIERRVAIKTMHRGLERGHEFLERFLREANVASQVTHPHLVSIHDFGQTDEGDLFIVMEYLDGESLGERLRRSRLTMAQTLKIAAQLCAALAAAHGAGIVHRDLKPDNIFLLHMPGDDIFIKLLDFGIAKHMNSQAMTQTGQVFGTPDYMSPEQCRGKSSIDHRSDLYALGCILYEVISGKPPFVSESMIQVLFRHVSDPVPQLVSLVDEPSLVAVERIISRLLQKKPRKRYATALVVREALDAALAQLAQPDILMPAWRSIEDDELSKASTARLGEVTQEELEVMMLEELSEPSEPHEDEHERPGHSLAYVETQDELPPVKLGRMASLVPTAHPEVLADEVDPSDLPPSSRKPVLALVALCVCVGIGVFLYNASKDGEIEVETSSQATTISEVGDMSSALAKSPTSEIVASAISTSQLLLHANAHRNAEAMAREEGERLASKSSNAPKPKRPLGKTTPKEKRNKALLDVRTKTSMGLRIDRASNKALKCLDRQLVKHPERYAELVGERFKVRVSMSVAPSGEVLDVHITQTSGKVVQDEGLMTCIKSSYADLKFNPTSPLLGNATQGAELSFALSKQ